MTKLRFAAIAAAVVLGLACGVASAQRTVPNPYYVEFSSVTIQPPFVNGFINFPTPLGRRYFIEQVSVSCTTPSNTDVFTQAFVVVAKVIGPTIIQLFPSPVIALQKRGPNIFGGYVWDGTAHVTLITDPNILSPDGSGGLSMNIFHTDTTVTATCSATMFGRTEAM